MSSLDRDGLPARRRWPSRIRRHALFGVVLALGAALRVVAMLGYRGPLWFPDSYSYLTVAVHPAPYPARPQGYAFFLRLLEPAHNLVFVVAVQHVLGLALGFCVYAVARQRFGVPAWGATLATLPVLFDGYQVQLEQLLMSDVLFAALVMVAVSILLWKPRSAPALVTAGLLLALATLTRSIGLPLLILFFCYLLVRRARVRTFAASLAVCVVPILGYMVWFHATWHTYSMTNSSGIFLYSRTAPFADCSRLHLPPRQASLCPREPVGRRTSSPNYVWHYGELGRLNTYEKFDPAVNQRAQAFAVRTITAQPLDYLGAALRDFGRTFQWNRTSYPTKYATRHYEFPAKAERPPSDHQSVPGYPLGAAIRSYAHDSGEPTVVGPYADFIRGYQRVIYLRGPLLGAILLGSVPGMVLRWRRCGGPAVVPWATAMALLVAPPLTAAFDYRYVLPAAPLACLALAISITGLRGRGERADRTARGELSPGDDARGSTVEPVPLTD